MLFDNKLTMKIIKIIKKAWPHILIISLMTVYFFIAPRLYTRFFIHNGKPMSITDLPLLTDQVKYNVEFLDPYDSDGTYLLKGWAFLTVDKKIPAGEYERQVVLYKAKDYKVYSAEVTSRSDVQTYFKDLGMDLTFSGFSAQIARDTIEEGSCGIGLIFKHVPTGATYYVDTHRCITRTPNKLVLEPWNSTICQVQTSQHQDVFNYIKLVISTGHDSFYPLVR
jgi:hypothetical protein